MAARTALRFEALFVIIVVVIVFPVVLFVLLILAVRLVIEADSCLDWEVSQQCFTIAVEVVIWLGFWPEQSVVRKKKIEWIFRTEFSWIDKKVYNLVFFFFFGIVWWLHDPYTVFTQSKHRVLTWQGAGKAEFCHLPWCCLAPLVGNKAVKREERGVRIHLQTKTSTASFLPRIYGVISWLATKQLYSTLGYIGYCSCDFR